MNFLLSFPPQHIFLLLAFHQSFCVSTSFVSTSNILVRLLSHQTVLSSIINDIAFPHQQSEGMLWKQFRRFVSNLPKADGTLWATAKTKERWMLTRLGGKNKNLIYQHQPYQHHHLSFCFAHVMFIMSVSRKGILDVRLTFHSLPTQICSGWGWKVDEKLSSVEKFKQSVIKSAFN